jgi:hypothetical protein
MEGLLGMVIARYRTPTRSVGYGRSHPWSKGARYQPAQTARNTFPTERPFLLKLRTEFGRPLSVCFVPIL